jgi:cation transport regulator
VRYLTDDELPSSVRQTLPESARKIYMDAFNRAWPEMKDPDRRREHESREAACARLAWEAVRAEYHRNSSGRWRPIEQ